MLRTRPVPCNRRARGKLAQDSQRISALTARRTRHTDQDQKRQAQGTVHSAAADVMSPTTAFAALAAEQDVFGPIAPTNLNNP
jgi:hypothetical protein